MEFASCHSYCSTELLHFIQRIRMVAYQRVIRKSGSWATEVIHLWHKLAHKETAERNAAIVCAKIVSKSNCSKENL